MKVGTFFWKKFGFSGMLDCLVKTSAKPTRMAYSKKYTNPIFNQLHQIFLKMGLMVVQLRTTLCLSSIIEELIAMLAPACGSSSSGFSKFSEGCLSLLSL